ncbi:DUF2934 domain-containing protein [Rhizobium sp. Root149]|uniref:DUF2934 domain-containing protein n=1 Tax=Rhizobium sp. Root149 TaxID=1736473 RepID=UPI0009EB6188|nr:DUF2934 domain-containing protein [Rhizobium sp. Root149]
MQCTKSTWTWNLFDFANVTGVGRMERNMADSESWIKQRAYELWEADGQPHGKHDEHWAQARAEYEAREKSNGKAPAKRKASAGSAEEKPSASKGNSTKPRAEKPAIRNSDAGKFDEAKPVDKKRVSLKKAEAKAVSKIAAAKPAVDANPVRKPRKSQPA